MKALKFFTAVFVAFLAIGAAASLYFSQTKEEYISFDSDNDLDLY